MANFVDATLIEGTNLSVNLDNIVFEIENFDGTYTYLLVSGNYITTTSQITQ